MTLVLTSLTSGLLIVSKLILFYFFASATRTTTKAIIKPSDKESCDEPINKANDATNEASQDRRFVAKV